MRAKYHSGIRRRLDTNRQFRRFFEQETVELPGFYAARVRRDLGWLWNWLPEGGLYHDPTAYFKVGRERHQLGQVPAIALLTGS
jgi:hypothetical protein